MSILKYESAFRDAVSERQRTICIDLLRQSPELTVGDLASLAKGPLADLLASITVGDLTGREPALVTAPRRSAPAAATAAATPRGARPAPADVRTPAARARYEASLLAALADTPGFTGVAALLEKAGGTNLQARAALNRLIEAGKVTWTGKARGTKYRLVSDASPARSPHSSPPTSPRP
ncbi:MAG TPA: hypothetical protein PKW35_04145 [Nannocystaceae bacterium]|nr:hypothetical protein [Nannocystaceae bacterium]